MTDLFKQMIAAQYEACLCMIFAAVDQCPDETWDQPVASLTYNQAAFHALIFTDIYLGTELKQLKEQPFHQQHAATFGDYEELENKPQEAAYTKEFIREYIAFCRTKAAEVVAAETEASLAVDPGFDWLKFSRAEVHVYNIRHLHHHAAQLSLKLRIETGDGVPWVGTGWKDLM